MEAAAIRGRGLVGGRAQQQRLALAESWFHQHYQPLLRFAYFVSGDRPTAEDLVHDAFERMWRRSGKITMETAGAYARAAIVNGMRSKFRRKTRERKALSLIDQAARRSVPPPDTSGDEVWAAIMTLSPQQRACVALRFYEGLSEAEVAATLGLTTGTVKTHTSRAMDKLRGALGNSEFEMNRREA